MPVATGTAYVVRCQHCGMARKSYNDPRRGTSVIECKRPCSESHYAWTFIREIPAGEQWPPCQDPPGGDPDVPVYVPVKKELDLAAHSGMNPFQSEEQQRQTVIVAASTNDVATVNVPANWDEVRFTSAGSGCVTHAKVERGTSTGVEEEDSGNSSGLPQRQVMVVSESAAAREHCVTQEQTARRRAHQRSKARQRRSCVVQ